MNGYLVKIRLFLNKLDFYYYVPIVFNPISKKENEAGSTNTVKLVQKIKKRKIRIKTNGRCNNLTLAVLFFECTRYKCNKLNYVNKELFLIGQNMKIDTLNKTAITTL